MASDKRRDAPRISVNKLGEYLTATPARRKRIVVDQKYPKAFQVTRYREAERAISDCLAAGKDPKVLAQHRERITLIQPKTPYESQTIHLCVEAIDSFSAMMSTLDLDRVVVWTASANAESLKVAGVAVSVRPELLIHREDRTGSRDGCLKLYFAKNGPLDELAGGYVATVLAEYADKALLHEGRIDGGLTMVLDVFAGTVFTAPRARTRRLGDVSAACEEIAARWASI